MAIVSWHTERDTATDLSYVPDEVIARALQTWCFDVNSLSSKNIYITYCIRRIDDVASDRLQLGEHDTWANPCQLCVRVCSILLSHKFDLLLMKWIFNAIKLWVLLTPTAWWFHILSCPLFRPPMEKPKVEPHFWKWMLKDITTEPITVHLQQSSLHLAVNV